MSATSVPSSPQRATLRLDSTGDAVSETLFNAMLTFTSLGIGRFWARSAWRRYVWRRIAVHVQSATHDDRPEYRGFGSELFLGVVFYAFALIPIWIVLQIGYLAIGVEGLSEWARSFALFLFVIGAVASVSRFRARRYRLACTTWRGVAFGQDGSAPAFLALSILWWGITIATAGLAWPWMQAARQRYLVDRARFGATRLRLETRTLALLPRWLLAWGAIVPPLAYIVAQEPYEAAGLLVGDFDLSTGVALVGLLPICVGLPAVIVYRTVELRDWIDGLRAGAARARCALSAGALLGPALGYLAIIGAAIAACVLSLDERSVEAAFGAQHAELARRALVLLAVAVAHQFAWPLVLQLPILARVLAATSIHGLDGADRETADDAPPLSGEGAVENFETG